MNFFPQIIARNMFGIQAFNTFNILFLIVFFKIIHVILLKKELKIVKADYILPLGLHILLNYIATFRFSVHESVHLTRDFIFGSYISPLQLIFISLYVYYGLKNKKDIKISLILLIIVCLGGSLSFLSEIQSFKNFVASYSEIQTKEYLLGSLLRGGMLLASFLPLMTALFLNISNKWLKIGLLITICISTFVIVWSFQRTYFFAAFIAILYVIFKSKKKYLFFFLIVFIMIFYSLLPGMFVERITYDEANLDSFTTGRIGIWSSAINLIKDNFIKIFFLGEGKAYYELRSESYFGPRFEDLHNIYLRLLIEQGILGLLIFMWLFIGIYKEAKHVYQNSQEKLYKIIGLVMISYLIFMLIEGFFTTYYLFEPYNMTFIYLIGLLTWIKKYDRSLLNERDLNRKE